MLQKKMEQACWVARSLFDKGRTAGAAGNISFVHDDVMYISGGGTCFGTLKKEDFAMVSMRGRILSECRPSKEWPLHLTVYRNKPDCSAVIHTHGTYSVLWSCVPNLNEESCVPEHTPYLRMRVGKIGLIPFETPGSKELFEAFEARVQRSDGYLLKRHGAVIGGKDVLEAFYGIEELEESARIAFVLWQAGIHLQENETR